MSEAPTGVLPTVVTEPVVAYPGARRPDRFRTVVSAGVRLSVVEWGDEAAPPVLLAHGGFDFAGTFDVFAPLLAAGGWRVVAWDHRGHGDSQHAALYSWDADVRDAVAVMDAVSRAPMPVVGHSKGGALMLQLAEACPYRISRLVNIDGMPSPRPHPDVASRERTKLMASELAGWLDWRRSLADATRKPGTLDDLARRRARMNPRLSHDWLRYLVSVGAREDADGWRWKIDPMLRMGGFGPWRNSWSLERLSGLGMPMLGMLGLIPEEMGWGTAPEELEPFLPPGGRLVAFDGVGHFVHIERPREVADLVLEFLS
ncbi:MAG TPA: alpha/beta hydrolase [Acidimicrobiales bacterium]|nr:alpha/beta hydrolase [Acidimicrobiales bacterium]